MPTSIYPDKSNRYDNLVYACTGCNLSKSDRLLPDAQSALIENSMEVSEDGTLRTSTTEARRIATVLGLNSRDYVEFRRLWIDIIALAENHDKDLFHKLLGFPKDLPDLKRLRPPGGNNRPEGIAQSWHARRERSKLPETY
jgi:hypothetical protein